MKHDPYSLTELIRNDDFIAWVTNPDVAGDRRWQLFLESYPEKKKTLEAAREYVILLAKDTGRDMPSSDQSSRMWSVVESRMRGVEESSFQPSESHPVEVKVGLSWKWMRVAASAVLILGIGSASYWFYYPKTGRSGSKSVASHIVSKPGVIQKQNDTDKPMMVLLTDGSSVVLQPGGTLEYQEKVEGNRREVTLTGKAFFEIIKDKDKPFLVYSYGLATKVLGTSFVIEAERGGKEIKVEVKTGTVSVFAIGDLDKEQRESEYKPELKGVLLRNDQRIAFSRENGKIVKLPAPDAGSPVVSDVSSLPFVFDETPASEVFSTLQSAYNIEIIYDKSRMGGCPLNATLVGQPFTEKLDVICNALDASYEITDNRVTISGRGCR